jgi:hypothetical protein
MLLERAIYVWAALSFVGFLCLAFDASAINAPVLKWKEGGCYDGWCETGWYSSPAVADLDGDGRPEVIASAYSIVALDGATGALQWRVKSGHDRNEPEADSVGRTWPAIWAVDVDGDNQFEIVTAHGSGWVSLYNHQGYLETGWPKRPSTSELRGLFIKDIDHDGTAEIIVSAAVSSKTSTWVYEHTGSLRAGWPQLDNSSGFAYGLFNDNVWAADLDGNGESTIVVPSDVHYICVYGPDGVLHPASTIYGDKTWGAVGVWESLATEIRGWGQCNGERDESNRANFAQGASVIVDVDGDGHEEIVATGNMYDCSVGHPPGLYTALFIFNADRSRFKKGAWNWEQAPVDTGAPLSEDYLVIENCQPNPAVADLDCDGVKEVLFASYDGRVHAFWMDKTEHANWPYSVYQSSEGFYRFASEPVVADLDRDGCSEVLFTSWPAKTDIGMRLGKLHVLDCHGSLLHELDLPMPKNQAIHWNGALPAPTIANIDGDSDYELVINTVHAGVIAYDLPKTSGARIQWRSGRNRGSDLSDPPCSSPATVTPKLHLLLLDE